MQVLENVIDKLDLQRFNTNKVVVSLNKYTKLRKEYISLVLLILILVVMFLTRFGQSILMNFFTFFYPSYKSFKALKSKERDDDRRWLIYWITYGLIFCFESMFGHLLEMFSALHLLYTIFLIAVYCPLTELYIPIYDYVIEPVLTKYENVIGNVLVNCRTEFERTYKNVKRTVINKVVE